MKRSSWRNSRTLLAVAVPLTAVLGSTAACSSEDSRPNAADRAYTTRVVEHHAQTLQILDLALGRPGLSSRVGSVADTTRREMFSEANTATRRLRAWHAPIPVTALEHHEMTSKPHFDPSIPGMLSARDLASLQHTKNGKFLSAWFGRLISHEAGAVQLARIELADGSDQATVAAARADMSRHRQRLAVLRSLRGQIGS